MTDDQPRLFENPTFDAENSVNKLVGSAGQIARDCTLTPELYQDKRALLQTAKEKIGWALSSLDFNEELKELTKCP